MLDLLYTYWHDLVSAVIGAGLSYVVTRWFMRQSVTLDALRATARRAQREAAEKVAAAALQGETLDEEQIEQAIAGADDGFFRSLEAIRPSPYDVVGSAMGIVSMDHSDPRSERAMVELTRRLRRESSLVVAFAIERARLRGEDVDDEAMIATAENPRLVRELLAYGALRQELTSDGTD